MILIEKSLPENERMDFVSIVTPNFLHFDPCKLALENGFHVMCEKPVAFNLDEAKALETIVLKSNLVFALTHNYTSYPMVKEAKSIIKEGKLGKIFKVIAEYQQGWLSENIESSGQKQALWRTDKSKAGISCCVADIGTHAENLTEYVTGLKIKELCADITSFVEGRELEDDANMLVRFDNGAKGAIIVSQVASGEENELKLRVFGEKGNLEWLQSDPNNLILKLADTPKQVLRPGNKYLNAETQLYTRLPAGHPEGYIESLANLYKNFGKEILKFKSGKIVNYEELEFPSISDGVRGMRFIDAVIHSGKNNSCWVII
ncbi:MAG: Gfo/Idh/MocA family oxidoreductase [Opitutaceae bacterium]|nr:Gfo/Idh/MocA family oxidoreductase [Cytophagales bacterium]